MGGKGFLYLQGKANLDSKESAIWGTTGEEINSSAFNSLIRVVVNHRITRCNFFSASEIGALNGTFYRVKSPHSERAFKLGCDLICTKTMSCVGTVLIAPVSARYVSYCKTH